MSHQFGIPRRINTRHLLMLMWFLAPQHNFEFFLEIEPLPDIDRRSIHLLGPLERTNTSKAYARVGLLYDINAASAVPAISNRANSVGEALARYTGQQEPASDVLSRVNCPTPGANALLLCRKECAAVS